MIYWIKWQTRGAFLLSGMSAGTEGIFRRRGDLFAQRQYAGYTWNTPKV